MGNEPWEFTGTDSGSFHGKFPVFLFENSTRKSSLKYYTFNESIIARVGQILLYIFLLTK
jgi:hypothetical protein